VQTQGRARWFRQSAAIACPPDIPARGQVQTAALCAMRLGIVQSNGDEMLWLMLSCLFSVRKGGELCSGINLSNQWTYLGGVPEGENCPPAVRLVKC